MQTEHNAQPKGRLSRDMQAIRSLVAYQWRVYVRTSKWIMPFCALVIMLGGVYAVALFRVADSYAFTCSLLIPIMTWAAFAATDMEDAVSEQILVLKAGRARVYYLSNMLFLITVGAVMAVICTLFPLLPQALSAEPVFYTPLTPGAMLCALALHLLAACLGASLGGLLHLRVVPNRTVGMLCLLFALLVGFVRPGIDGLLPAARYVTALFPPVSLASTLLSGEDYFAAQAMARLCGTYAAYAAIVFAAQIALRLRRKFA